MKIIMTMADAVSGLVVSTVGHAEGHVHLHGGQVMLVCAAWGALAAYCVHRGGWIRSGGSGSGPRGRGQKGGH